MNSFSIHWNTANTRIRKYNQSILILFPETLLLYKKDYSISYIPNKALSTKESTNRSKSMKLCIHVQEKTATLSLTAVFLLSKHMHQLTMYTTDQCIPSQQTLVYVISNRSMVVLLLINNLFSDFYSQSQRSTAEQVIRD